MLSRKEQNRSGNPLPETWREKVTNLLNSVYAKRSQEQNKTFKVFGFSYPDELFIAASLIHPDNNAEIPVTYVASCDISEKTDYRNIADTLIDSIGIFFDSYFATVEWNDYNSNWMETKHKEQTFYYKITRENIELTIKADEILANTGN